jgi:hypothetical protein
MYPSGLRDSLFNLMFRCRHRNLSRPFATESAALPSEWNAYVVCLDCSMRFAYDTHVMRMGNAIRPDGALRRGGEWLRTAAWIALPASLLVAALKWKK